MKFIAVLCAAVPASWHGPNRNEYRQLVEADTRDFALAYARAKHGKNIVVVDFVPGVDDDVPHLRL